MKKDVCIRNIQCNRILLLATQETIPFKNKFERLDKKGNQDLWKASESI